MILTSLAEKIATGFVPGSTAVESEWSSGGGGGRLTAARAREYLEQFYPSPYIAPFMGSVVASVQGGSLMSRTNTRSESPWPGVDVVFVHAPPYCTVQRHDMAFVRWMLSLVLPLMNKWYSQPPDPLTEKSSRHPNHQTLTIVCCLCDGQRKAVPIADAAGRELEQAWTSAHVNSGLSILNLARRRGASLMVYRREEYPKVLLHELLHCHGLDIHMHDFAKRNPRIDGYICEKLGIVSKMKHANGDGDLCLGEALTDVAAIQWYAALEACLAAARRSQKTESLKRIGQIYSEQLKLHCAAAMEKCAAVVSRLDLFRSTSSPSSPISPGSRKPEPKKFTQETHVFAYYVAKCALLYRSDPADVGLLQSMPRISSIESDADAWRFVGDLCAALADKTFASALARAVDAHRQSERQKTLKHMSEPGPKPDTKLALRMTACAPHIWGAIDEC